tara:strand:- start:986 stop:1525 length:540 start_codon:yes stop_codon:yes gene_type:complete
MSGSDLTRFKFKEHGFAIFAYQDIVNAYEDNGLILYPGHVAMVNLNLDDNSCFVLDQTFRAELGFNEDGATIEKTGKEVAHEYVQDLVRKGGIVDLTEWDAGDTHEIKDDVTETAKLKADMLPLTEGIELRVTKHDANHVEFEFYDSKNNMLAERIRSFEPNFAASFSQMLSRFVATHC